MLSFLYEWCEQIRLSRLEKRRQRALCDAIYSGNLERVRELVSGGLDLDFVQDGLSPLIPALAAMENMKPDGRKIFDYLMAHGASPGNPGNDYLLSSAARLGEHEIIDLALAAGHDIHFRPRQGTTPLQSAAFRNKPETMKYLIARGAVREDFDVTRCSWVRLNAATINVLLDSGVEVPNEIAGYVKTGKW